MRDISTALELRDVDIPDVLEELGSPLYLIKEETYEESDPTKDNTMTKEYLTNGVVFINRDYYGRVLSAAGEREIIIDLNALDGVMPEVADSVREDDIVYKITDVELYRFAGIPVAAALKAEM
ncbi:MAG: hypothetical protein NC124_02350 [Clostridium sp.]|nr:hypothetical protein [Clostridium sp.]